MKISNINNFAYNQSFKARYKTEDVLRLVTYHPYKDKDSTNIVRSLTGVDVFSKEFTDSQPRDYTTGIVHFVVSLLTLNKVLAQKPELQEVRDAYDSFYKYDRTTEEKDNWFKAQIDRLGKSININPITITAQEIDEEYIDTCKMIEEMQFLQYSGRDES